MENEVSNLPPPMFRKDDSMMSLETSQDVIMEAMLNGESDPKKLQQLAGLKRVADVYIALEKLDKRRQYNLMKHKKGLTLDLVLGRLKTVIENQDDEVALKGINVYMRAEGLDRNDDAAVPTKGWEDLVLEKMLNDGRQAIDVEVNHDKPYEVVQPPMPEALRKRKEQEKEEGAGLYESSSK